MFTCHRQQGKLEDPTLTQPAAHLYLCYWQNQLQLGMNVFIASFYLPMNIIML